MNIGIDIDGVITNIDFLGILGKNKPILDKESSNLKVNNFLIRKILYKGIAFYSKHSKLRSDAAKYINLLKDDGNRITIITKRRFAGEETKEGKDIRKRYSNKEPIYKIAKLYNVGWTTVSHIVKNETWKNI